MLRRTAPSRVAAPSRFLRRELHHPVHIQDSGRQPDEETQERQPRLGAQPTVEPKASAKSQYQGEHKRHPDCAELTNKLPGGRGGRCHRFSVEPNDAQKGSSPRVESCVGTGILPVRCPMRLGRSFGDTMSRHSIVRLVAGALTALFISVVLVAQSAERVLYVSVWEEKTRVPITGLGTDAFAVREDGAAREVLRVTPATSPMSVAILVDNSQSATPTIADLRKALASFVRSLDGIGAVAIIGLADRPTILRDYTTDQKQLQDGIHRVFAMPGSGSTLLDAIVEVSQGLAKRDTDRAAMVIVTGENREFSNRHYREVLEALDKSGAMMHALVLNGPGGSSLDDEARNRASVLDLGPRASGGTRDDVLTSQAFEAKLLEFAAMLKSQHRVVYSRPQTLIPPEKIEVSAAKPGLAARGGPARGQAVR